MSTLLQRVDEVADVVLRRQLESDSPTIHAAASLMNLFVLLIIYIIGPFKV